MATTRRPPLEIFEDPSISFDHHEISQADASLLSAYDPSITVSLEHHTLLNPTSANVSGSSPHKSSDHPSSSPPPSALSEANLNAISIPPPYSNTFLGSPTKKIMPPPRRVNTLSNSQQAALAGIFPPLSGACDQENAPPSSRDGNTQAPEFVTEKKSGWKRSLGDVAPAKERVNKKQKPQEEEAPFQVPDPEDMPTVVDPGVKPDHSYAILIGMALLRAPNRRLTLAQIYKWISDNFSYYSPADSGWQNSIRHNLSLNKNFVKQGRPKEDPGKGHYWTIQPGQEHVFLKEKAPRRPSAIVLPPNTSIIRPSTAPSVAAPASSSQAKVVDSSKFPDDTDISSDATIPCSDPAIHDSHDFSVSMPPPSRTLRSSPPPQADIRSSPPAPPSRHSVREDTPPKVTKFTGNSRSGGRKRKFAGLGDSGYYSSIESSATKAYAPHHPLLTSEADFDRPSLKPGRAELEIVRIRSSSYDSPVKSGPHKKSRSASHLHSSSPFHPFDRPSKTSAPLTPPVIFKRPAKPPASVSPNTNLRNHRNRIREFLNTPDRPFNLFTADNLQTPGFDPADIPELPGLEPFSLYADEPELNNTYDVFNDLDFSLTARGSPEKRSVKRPKLDRALTSTNALADITSSKSNTRLMSSPTKFLVDPDEEAKTPFYKTPTALKPAPRLSASKGPTSNPFAINDENSFFDRLAMPPPTADTFSVFNELHSDGSEEGFDILQGFQKIGAVPTTVAANGSPVKQSRPALGRSTTTMF